MNFYDHISVWMCNIVVNAKPSSEVTASRNESTSLPVVIQAYSMMEIALALVDYNISLEISLEQEN